MSFAFAKRHRILAVESTAEEVVIAGAEPLVSAWEPDLGAHAASARSAA